MTITIDITVLPDPGPDAFRAVAVETPYLRGYVQEDLEPVITIPGAVWNGDLCGYLVPVYALGLLIQRLERAGYRIRMTNPEALYTVNEDVASYH